MSTPTLSIIIVNYNTPELLFDLVKSVKTKISHEIIVVDNASTDNSTHIIQTKLKSVKLIQNQKNKGFAAANNQAIKQAKGKYILLLNSDTKVLGSAIETMIEHLKSDSKIGIVGPFLELSNGQLDPASHRGLPTPWNSFTYFSGLAKLFPRSKFFSQYHQTYSEINTTHQVQAVSGAAMLFAKSLTQEIGLFDEQFFMYAEDLDFCARTQEAGYKVIFLPTARILHLKGKSGTKSKSKKISRSTKSHFYTTMKQYFKKHYPHYPWLICQLIFKGIDLVSIIKK